MESIRAAGLSLAVDPLGGAGVGYWEPINRVFGLDIDVVNKAVDPTFAFMTVDHDGKIRMDCSSPYAMARLVHQKDRYRVAFANDPDADRHGIVTPSAGLLNPNHYLAVAIRYLLTHRPQWSSGAAIGKTLVSSSMIDRVVASLGRKLTEVPVGFKWFTAGLLDGSLAFGGEESAGASFLSRDGSVWTTDKDGIAMNLLAAEMTARTGRDPGEHYRELTAEFGAPVYTRIDAPATPAQKAQLTASAVNVGGLAVGALVAGVLAQWVAHPLTVPYLVFGAALVLAGIGVALVPETHEAPKPRPRYRPQRLSIPHEEMGRFFAAALSTFWAFAANGLFAGLAGVFLAGTLHHPSRALAGGVVAVMFGAAVAAQFLTVGWSVTRELAAGMATIVIGIGLAVLAVWLHSPSLALFIAGGALIGAGSGAIFKGAVGTVMSIAPPGRIAESLTGVFLCAYVGISLPVVGAGTALTRGVSPKVTILGFAIALTAGIAASAIKLLGRPTTPVPAGPAAPPTSTTGRTTHVG